ncbi:MAG TPA: 2OG-Fe(II) oxygenase [Streptosporangiaceae bacterium]
MTTSTARTAQQGASTRAGNQTTARSRTTVGTETGGAGSNSTATQDEWAGRMAAVRWDEVAAGMNDVGCALTGPLLTPAECRELAVLYDQPDHFRSTIDMARYRFGSGQYRYFAAPFPGPVQQLRHALYPRLLPIARDWHGKLGRPAPWPDTLGEWLEMCHAAGQVKPTPILLRYRAGDWNALHRDLYGDLVFPMQMVINLSSPGADHEGGEFLLVEQRPRAQSRGTATLIPQGHGLVFTTRDRPVASQRGWSAAPVRHGVSLIRSGERFSLGLVLHDAA